MAEKPYDSIVIGAGSAGLAYAQTAADLGARILMIERAELGGTCVNRGCVPKKILWAAGGLMNEVRDAAGQKIATASNLDFETLAAKRDAHIADIRDSFSSKLDQAGISLVRGQATLAGEGRVTVDGTIHDAGQIILAAGGRPIIMEILGKEHLATSQDVLSWNSLPKSMVVAGGGYIGCEFAAIFHALGCHVTLLHKGERLLETFPEALAGHVLKRLRSSGVKVILNDRISAVTKREGQLNFETKAGVNAKADVIVGAIGRQPNIDDLGPRAKGLATVESGALAIDDHFQTSLPGIYAIGDIADRLPLTPVATTDGTTLAHMLHGNGARQADLAHVATTAFVYPPAAYVGRIGDAPEYDGTVTPLPAQVLRASDGEDTAFYQIDFDQAGPMKGAAIAVEGAENMIALAAAMLADGTTSDAFVKATGIHPSFAEEFFSEVR